MNRRGTLLGTFFPPLAVTLIVTLVLVTGFSGRAIRQFFVKRTSIELEHICQLTASQFSDLIQAGDYDRVQALCRSTGKATGMRLTVILADGQVVGDSVEKPRLMDNHAGRPEVRAALDGRIGRSTRYSPTLAVPHMYVAMANLDPPAPYVVRASLSLAVLSDIMSDVYRRIALVGLIMAILAALTSYLLARRLSGGLQQLQAGAEAFARGELEGRLTAANTSEIAGVAEAMNLMAGQLAERFTEIVRQRNESEAVLASMSEGVVAVDDQGRVLGLNRAGGRLLAQDPAKAVGRSIQEVGRNSSLTRLVQEALADENPLERDVQLGFEADRWLQLHASTLKDQENHPFGVLVVMNDVTRLRRLENMRRDFVANVSHELKTPITSIKGFVETLLDDPPENRAELSRFLRIINKQSDRLDAIITDLLVLSRLEQDADSDGLETRNLPLAPVVERVVRDLAPLDPTAAGRITVACEPDLRAPINSQLIEQAVGNLVGNALKYSPPGSPIRLTCRAGQAEVTIAVSDEGPGIAARHLPRLFERFYRVDKARSREMGGTGLGLAICKHIAQAHQGRIEVRSEVGAGSTFTIHLPREGSA